MWLSQRAQNIKPSPTLAIEAKAKALKAQGVDIISFGAGEPDFDTPDNIKNAAQRAITDGFTKYCPVPGTPDLKQAIIEKFAKDNNLSYSSDEIIVSCGAKHSLYNLFQAVFNRGDEVLIPAPYWVSYPDMAALAGAKAKIIKTREEDSFKMTAEQLRKAVGRKTKALVVNSPSNPTGGAYTADELKAIGEVCVEKNLLIISDEIYEKLAYDGFTPFSIAAVSPAVKAQTVVVNGVSKAYAMTGWRIGYAAGPKEIIGAMSTIQSQSTSNPTSISMKAAAEALKGSQESVAVMRTEFAKRRDYIVERLNNMPGIKCAKPQGAFYVFPNVKKLLGKAADGKTIDSAATLAAWLLETAKIAVVPGEPFGAPGHLRLSYATSLGQIRDGMDRLETALKTLY
jgi:aspartate aminotransferase